MRIAVLKETTASERRVALVPDVVRRLIKAGLEVRVEEGAGVPAHFPDPLYSDAGATLSPDRSAALADVDVLLKVQPPTAAEIGAMRAGAGVVAFLHPGSSGDLFRALADARVTGFAMELVPRITKAQSMDALSSQATVAGYKAVLLGAAQLGRLLPMLTTAAGTLAPAKVFVIGAGVAGLQAIATARRLGGVVSAFDVRPVVKEQVQSLGAKFLESEAVTAEAEAAGGYAKELAQEQQQRVLETIGGHVPGVDLVITTAQIPGKPAPRLITAAMVRSMRAGSVIVDLAGESGGNCELTRAGETVQVHDVTVLGPVNLPSSLPVHASEMYSRNLATFLEYVLKDGAFHVDLDDPIVGPMCVTHAGEIRYGGEGVA